MTKILIILASILLVLGLSFFLFSKRSEKQVQKSVQQFEEIQTAEIQKETKMRLISPAFGDNDYIPSEFTCDGKDISPQFEISEAPEGARSLVLLMDDPDAPRRIFDHWVVWNIPPNMPAITENSIPEGALEGKTSFGKTGYGGPCPPSGTHHYRFKLYALDVTLDLPASANKADVERAMEGHVLDQAVLTGLYQRQ